MTPPASAAPALVRNWHLLLTFSQPLVRIKTLRSCNRGDENVVHLGAFWLHVGATPGTRGLHTLPWPTARRPIASSGDRTLRRTAFTSDSPAARARILAPPRTRSRVGGQASGAYHEGRTATTSV